MIACEIYNQVKIIDEVWIVPCGDGRSDKGLKSDAIHRLKMLELLKMDLIYDDLPIFIKDTEIQNKKYMPTWDLLEKLNKDYPENKFFFSCGSDIANSIITWDFGKELCEKYNFIIITRPGYSIIEYKDLKSYIILECSYDNSSTKIRSRIEEFLDKKNKVHLGISGLTSRSVLNYIYSNNLYKIDSICMKETK
jgi:nicotinate (nicotinamide) nucleotide adenylyltransferase